MRKTYNFRILGNYLFGTRYERFSHSSQKSRNYKKKMINETTLKVKLLTERKDHLQS